MKLDIKQQSMAIIIFARLNSKRLPKKVLQKIRSKPLLLLIVDRIRTKSKFKLPIIVATSHKKSDDEIDNFCKSCTINPQNLLNVRGIRVCGDIRNNTFFCVCTNIAFTLPALFNGESRIAKSSWCTISGRKFAGSFPWRRRKFA